MLVLFLNLLKSARNQEHLLCFTKICIYDLFILLLSLPPSLHLRNVTK